MGEQSGLLTRIAATESDSLCVQIKSWLRLWNSNRRFVFATNDLTGLLGFPKNGPR